MCLRHDFPDGASDGASDARAYDAGASDAGFSEESDSPSDPAYTPDELAVIFLDFYTFLTTLHYDAAHLKVPPPGGWPGLTPELCASFGRSDYTIEVLRRLPYFEDESKAYIHYKSRLIDYSSFTLEDFEDVKYRDEFTEIWTIEGDGPVDLIHIFCIAAGRETHGRELFLNVQDGGITEDMVRSDQVDPVDVRSYFDNLKEAYRSLKLIPCPGRITIEAWDVPERADDTEITEEQVRSQTEGWKTDLDIQYVRQIYRQHGWPDAFRKDEAKKVVDELLESMEEQRNSTWEGSPQDWDQWKWK